MKDLVERFRADPATVQPWRVAANRAVRVGDRAFFFKQGQGARGVVQPGSDTREAPSNTAARRADPDGRRAFGTAPR